MSRQMDDWRIDYAEMVSELMHKDGEQSPLWVLALGLCGEAAEASQASNAPYDSDYEAEKEVIAELGDVLWYATAMMISLGACPARPATAPTGTSILESAGLIADYVKKSAWHGKPLDPMAIDRHLQNIARHIAGHAQCYGVSLEEVARRNTAKLRARYPKGFTEGGGLR